MNDEQKHKEDLESAKGWLAIAKKDNNTTAIQILENLFPELREGEDEIFKELLHNLIVSNDCTPSSKEIFSVYGKTKEDCISWLEKQKEDNNEEFGEFINNLSKQFPEVSFAKLSRIAVRVKNWLEKQCEQKPFWSKDNENILNEVKLNFEINKEEMTPALIECYENFFEKIKYLTPQVKNS